MKSERPSLDQVCELMARIKAGRISSAELQAFLEDPASALQNEPKVETGEHSLIYPPKTINIAGYTFQKIHHPNGSEEIKLGEFEVKDEPLETKISAAGFVPWYSGVRPNSFDCDMTAERLPPKKIGVVRLSLLHTGGAEQRECEFEQLTKNLERVEADVYQGLEVAKRFPNLQRKLSILMFGSLFEHHGRYKVPNLTGDKERRYLKLYECSDKTICNSFWALVVG